MTDENELVHAEVAVERMHAWFLAAEQAELTYTFAGYGADLEPAATMAAAVSADTDTALRFPACEELGVNPDELPSRLLAGGASLAAFSLWRAAAAGALPGSRSPTWRSPWPSP